MGPYLGNITEDATLDFIWDSNDSNGASITRATNGTISVYKANGTTQSTAGITDIEDFDSVTGIHHVRIDTSSDAFYATANDYTVVLSAATIDGQTVNAVLASFSIENRFDEVDLTKILGSSQSAIDAKDFFDAGYDPITNKIQGLVLCDTTTTNTDVRGTDSAALASVCTEARLAELDAGNLITDVANVKTDTAAILIDTAVIGAAGAGLTDLGGMSTGMKAEVNTEADTALSDINLDHLVGTATGLPAIPSGTYLDQLLDDGTASFDRTTDSLQAIRDRGDVNWSSAAMNPSVLQETTIATLASQTSFTLTAGSADDDAYNGSIVVVEDAATATQKAVGVVSDYTGSTKTITLLNDPGVFTMAVADTISVIADRSLKTLTDNRILDVTAANKVNGVVLTDTVTTLTGHTVQTGDSFVIVNSGTFGNAQLVRSTTPANTLDVNATGEAGIDWGNIGNKGATVDLSATDINLVDTTTTNTDMLTAAAVNAEVDTALVDINLDHLMKVAVTGADVVDDTVIALITSKSATADFDTFDNTTDSFEAIRDRGDAAWSSASMTPEVLQNTTIATLASQTSFTLTAGSADDDAYNGALIIIIDSATSTQKAVGLVSDYTGSTKTITLDSDPGIFTMATGDTLDILATPKQLPNTVLNDVSTTQINAEMVDVIRTDTNSEPAQAAPATAETMQGMISQMYFKDIVNIQQLAESDGIEKTLMVDGTTVRHSRLITDVANVTKRAAAISG